MGEMPGFHKGEGELAREYRAREKRVLNALFTSAEKC